MHSNSSLKPKHGLRARLLRRSLYASLAIGLVLAASASHAQTLRADHLRFAPCSNRTIQGDYGFNIEGTVLADRAPALLRGVAMTHFDGQGNLTQVDFATLNGVPYGDDWRSASGKYEIKRDCTGAAVISPDDGAPSLSLRLVVVDGGRQVFTIVEGNATGSWGIRVR